MRNAEGRDREAARLERLPVAVLACVEALGEHPRDAELLPELLELREPAGGQPELGLRQLAARSVHGAERPRDEVAPVVEVEVGDHDRIDPRPAVLLAKSRQNAWPAVEQEPPRPLDEVSR